MKRLMVFVVSLAFLFCASAFAADKPAADAKAEPAAADAKDKKAAAKAEKKAKADKKAKTDKKAKKAEEKPADAPAK